MQNRPRRKCRNQIDYSGKRSPITHGTTISGDKHRVDPYDVLADMATDAEDTSKQGMTLNESVQVGQIPEDDSRRRRHVGHTSTSRQSSLFEHTSAQNLESKKLLTEWCSRGGALRKIASGVGKRRREAGEPKPVGRKLPVAVRVTRSLSSTNRSLRKLENVAYGVRVA